MMNNGILHGVVSEEKISILTSIVEGKDISAALEKPLTLSSLKKENKYRASPDEAHRILQFSQLGTFNPTGPSKELHS